MTEATDRVAGSICWAVVPYAPAPPFRLYAGEDRAPIVVESTDDVLMAARRGGDAEFTYLVPGKIRPVLVLADPPDRHHREVAALRLLRLARLDADERDIVRRGEDPLLVYVDPRRVDLPDENAIMISALVRLHVEAIAAGPPAGRLEPDELQTVGERVVRYYGIDVGALVERRIRELAARRRGA